VQVSDSTTSGSVSPSPKDGSAESAPGADLIRRRTRSGSRFREALKRSEIGEASAELAGALTSATSGLQPAPIRVGPPPAKSASAVAAAPKIDRLLVGSTGGEAEARIRIGAGVLAGAEIRLTASVGSPAVTAQLLTSTAGSRQTLSVAMEEIRLRLRDKGIVLAPSVARGRPSDDARQGGGDDGRQSRGAEARGGERWPSGR
jgi:hypothetical protein